MRAFTIILLVTAVVTLTAAVIGVISGPAIFWLGIALLAAQTTLYLAGKRRR